VRRAEKRRTHAASRRDETVVLSIVSRKPQLPLPHPPLTVGWAGRPRMAASKAVTMVRVMKLAWTATRSQMNVLCQPRPRSLKCMHSSLFYSSVLALSHAAPFLK